MIVMISNDANSAGMGSLSNPVSLFTTGAIVLPIFIVPHILAFLFYACEPQTFDLPNDLVRFQTF